MNKIKFQIFAVIILLAAILTINLLPGIFYKSGRNFLAQGKNVEAYKKLKTAYLLKPTNKDYRYYYVKVMSNLKPSEKIQKEMFELNQTFLKIFLFYPICAATYNKLRRYDHF